jgi:hypothetical protein
VVQEAGFTNISIFFVNFNKSALMKKLLLTLISSAFYFMAFGQVTDSFSYKAIVRNNKGEIVKEQSVSVQINILQGADTGEIVYSEKHLVTTSQSGLISVSIGNGTDKTGEIESINWISSGYFLKVEIDPDGGNNFTVLSIAQILIVADISPPEASEQSSPLVEEEELFISRKYVGRFIDFRHTGLSSLEGPSLIWIKTSMEGIYGKISAYGKNCKFSVGDNLYVRRTLYTPGGISGRWIYQIENDSSAYYRCTDFQHDKKIFVYTWF